MKKFLLLCFSLAFVITAWAQERVVSGRVTSQEDGSSLPGVNVVVKGTVVGTATSADGKYSISVPGSGSVTLIFSFIGLTTQEVSAETRSVIDVVMASDARQLSEIVITGYREESRQAITGTINIVTAKNIQDVPIASIDQILQGRSPGVLVLGGSGQPGAAANVTIRGRGSISASTLPLYVLDGVPIDPQSFNTLNPNDYEVVSILTDASATSIYGSRAANGVILLNSKKGKAGETKFTYRGQYGVAKAPENRLKLMDTNEKIDFELLTGGGPLDDLSESEISELRTINTDWAGLLFQDAPFMTHELSAQGGNANTTFFFSMGYLNQEGSVTATGLERLTTRVNLANETGRFRFGINSTFGYSTNNNTLEGNTFIASPLNAVNWANPYEKPYDANGDYTNLGTGQPNPLEELLENDRQFNDIKAVANFYAAYELPIKGLSIRTLFGVDYGQSESSVYNDRTTYQGSQAVGQQGSLNRGFFYDARFINTNSINYNTTFGSDHSFSMGLYQETNYRKVTSFNYTGYGLTGNLENEAGLTVSPIFLPALGGNNTENGLSSWFTDIKYGFKDRYHLSLGLRRDGSSRFGSGNQYANFYSIGANWIISDEAFLQDLTSVFSLLKLNASYGLSGNQEGIGNFQSRELYSSASGFSYNGQAGVRQVQLENANLQWETQKMFDVSLEFGLLADRITGKVGFYNRLTEDLLFNSPLSRTTGFLSLTQNVGSLLNRGIEVSLGADIIRTNGFVWNFNGNFTYNQNEVVSIYGGVDRLPQGLNVLEVGKPLGSWYVVDYVGVNPATGDALYRKLDGTITSVYSSSDLRPQGTRFAPRFGGFTNTFEYKGLELSIFFTYVHGNQVFNNERSNVENPTYFVDGMAQSMLRAWKQSGDITDVPRVQTVDGLTTAPFQDVTTRYLENGSFLRLRNVLLAYNFPQAIISKAKLSSVRLFVQGQNLWTKTEYQSWDPELAVGFQSGAQYPALRTTTVGLNIGF